MTETPIETSLSETVALLGTEPAAPLAIAAPAAGPRKHRFAAVAPVLEKLFELYPKLFGQHFLPLKLGVFHEILAAHPEVFQREELKSALGVHTRSTRYLQSVASGAKRHDLQGQAVDDVAPEHVFLSIVELFRRRQARSQDDLKPKLRMQFMSAYEASGLSRQDYLARVPAPEETLGALLDDAIAEVEQKRARRVALVKAFEGSGKSMEEFADSLAIKVQHLRDALRHSKTR